MSMVKRVIGFAFVAMLAFPNSSNSQVPEIPENLKPGEYIKNIIPMRQRVQIMERALRWKKEHVLPMVMREQGIDLWIIRNDEADLYYNNEGPVYTSLLPADFQRGSHTDREMYVLLTSLLRHGEPKLLRAAEVNLRSLLKQARTSTVPWQNRPSGHFEPPND